MNVSKRYDKSAKNVEKTINFNDGLVDDDQSIVLGHQTLHIFRLLLMKRYSSSSKVKIYNTEVFTI